jgi:peroxiredoxin
LGFDPIVLESFGKGDKRMGKLITPGDLAPEFELKDVQGNIVRLSDFRGQPLVLAFLRGFM